MYRIRGQTENLIYIWVYESNLNAIYKNHFACDNYKHSFPMINHSFRHFARKLILKLNPYSPYPVAYDFRMSKEEIQLFDRKVSKSKNYLEFGLGGSTLRVLQKSNAKVETVETSKEWIKIIKKYWYIRRNLKKRLVVHYVDIGTTKDWGYPVDDSNKDLFPNFSEKIFQTIACEKLDTVLIDGRFRVACTLNTVINCYKNDDLVILIHDYFGRTHYHVVEEFLDLKERADTLGVFKIKQDLNFNQLEKLYNEYKFNSA